jgi:hypothetical protein
MQCQELVGGKLSGLFDLLFLPVPAVTYITVQPSEVKRYNLNPSTL